MGDEELYLRFDRWCLCWVKIVLRSLIMMIQTPLSFSDSRVYADEGGFFLKYRPTSIDCKLPASATNASFVSLL